MSYPTNLESSACRTAPSNQIEAETYQAYDWLKIANSSARMGKILFALTNLERARESIDRAIAHAEAHQKAIRSRFGIRQQAFLKALLKEGVWRKDWCIITNSITQKIADSMVKKKLVHKRPARRHFFTAKLEYLLTDAGKDIAKAL